MGGKDDATQELNAVLAGKPANPAPSTPPRRLLSSPWYMLTTLVHRSVYIPFGGDHVMQFYRASILICFCAVLCHAQATKADQTLLNQAREKYDAPFNRNLQSFDCAVEFSWKQHFTETPRVGDEGTDEELEKLIQPIRNRVAVTRQNVTVSSGLTEDAEHKLPHGGMAEGLLEHAVQKSLYTWLDAGTNSILPGPGTPVSFEQSPSGYKLSFRAQTSDVEMILAPDMRLQRASLKANQSEHFEISFAPGPQGFLLTSWTMGEDGNFEPGNRLIYSYTYQTVDGVELPENVSVVRESHHEVWRYKLSGCIVKTSE